MYDSMLSLLDKWPQHDRRQWKSALHSAFREAFPPSRMKGDAKFFMTNSINYLSIFLAYCLLLLFYSSKYNLLCQLNMRDFSSLFEETLFRLTRDLCSPPLSTLGLIVSAPLRTSWFIQSTLAHHCGLREMPF